LVVVTLFLTSNCACRGQAVSDPCSSERHAAKSIALDRAGWKAPSQQSREAKSAEHPLFELNGLFVAHTYKSDSNGQFQYGTPPVEFGMGGSFGMTSRGGLYGAFGAEGVNETILTSGLPPQVIAAAEQFSNPSLDVRKTSLRLQDAWSFGGGWHPMRNFGVGFRYSRDSWRYDWLGYPAGTTIPYLKGILLSRIAYIRYDGKWDRLQFMLNGGAGAASAEFRRGIETYLHDGYEAPIIGLPAGFTVPLSGRLGLLALRPNPKESGDKTSLITFVRYDYAESKLAGTTVLKRQIVAGFEMVYGAR
jgi:hypothetical protein